MVDLPESDAWGGGVAAFPGKIENVLRAGLRTLQLIPHAHPHARDLPAEGRLCGVRLLAGLWPAESETVWNRSFCDVGHGVGCWVRSEWCLFSKLPRDERRPPWATIGRGALARDPDAF